MKPAHPARISLKLRELAQLFNSMDPSPFIERDLDDDAEEFIVGWAREFDRRHPLELTVHLGSVPDAALAAETEHAVQRYFATRADMKRREFRLLLRRAYAVLAIGVLFLATCLVLSSLAARLFPGGVGKVMHEGLLIVGWVAMWRPLEMFLYDWWPVRRDWVRLQRLARMRVRLVPPAAARPGADTAPAPPSVPPSAGTGRTAGAGRGD